jgi:hypothetical protein
MGARSLSMDKTERTIVGSCGTSWLSGNSNQRNPDFS